MSRVLTTIKQQYFELQNEATWEALQLTSGSSFRRNIVSKIDAVLKRPFRLAIMPVAKLRFCLIQSPRAPVRCETSMFDQSKHNTSRRKDAIFGHVLECGAIGFDCELDVLGRVRGRNPSVIFGGVNLNQDKQEGKKAGSILNAVIDECAAKSWATDPLKTKEITETNN